VGEQWQQVLELVQGEREQLELRAGPARQHSAAAGGRRQLATEQAAQRGWRCQWQGGQELVGEPVLKREHEEAWGLKGSWMGV
jgi:hypothetical protein